MKALEKAEKSTKLKNEDEIRKFIQDAMDQEESKQASPNTVRATAALNRAVKAELKTASALVQHYKADPWDSNYRITEKIFRDLCDRFGWVPNLDIACDRHGSNSLAPLYYSPEENALEQDLRGYWIVCNPPYDPLTVESYALKLEQTMQEDPTTKVMFIVPFRPEYTFFERNQWTCWVYL